MAQQDIKALLEKIQSGNFTPEEERIAKYWLLKLEQQDTTDLSDEELEAISQEMWASLESLPNIHPKTRRLWPRIAAAASILLCCSIGLYFYQHNKQTASPTQIAKNDIAPGHNQATLTLANGQKIILTKNLKGQIAVQGNTIIQAAGAITYNTSDSKEEPIAYNTLSTARAEQSPLALVLADGTKAWLNAESSITYPVVFNGKDRTVNITGEVYFEVAHNSQQPFRVKTANQTIEDIGTHFNVNAYPDEPATTTTLLEGVVKVNNLTLKPGQKTDGKTITDANTDAVVAWKNGYFQFDDEHIEPIMRRIARWYNVEVVYTGKAPTDKFYGYVPRFSNVSQVLKKLEYSNKVHFKIEGRRLMVSR